MTKHMGSQRKHRFVSPDGRSVVRGKEFATGRSATHKEDQYLDRLFGSVRRPK